MQDLSWEWRNGPYNYVSWFRFAHLHLKARRVSAQLPDFQVEWLHPLGICETRKEWPQAAPCSLRASRLGVTISFRPVWFLVPNLPTRPCRLNVSRTFCRGLRIPPINIKILLESNPLKSRILARRLAVPCSTAQQSSAADWHQGPSANSGARQRRSARHPSQGCCAELEKCKRGALKLLEKLPRSVEKQNRCATASLATKIAPTKIIPTKICRLTISGKRPMDLRIPPLNIQIMLGSNPLKSRILVRRSAVPLEPAQSVLSIGARRSLRPAWPWALGPPPSPGSLQSSRRERRIQSPELRTLRRHFSGGDEMQHI